MTPPRRQLGFTIAAAIVVANMIGTGVFTSAGYQAQAVQDPGTLLLAWVVGGVLALCGAATYAELGSMMPRAGGDYVYLREAYHPAVGFLSGWVSLTAGFSAPIAASALAFASYLGKVVPGLHGDAWFSTQLEVAGHHVISLAVGAPQLIAIGLIAVVTALHAGDARLGGWVQVALTTGKVIVIAAFIIAGVVIGDGDWDNLAPRAGGITNAATPAFAIALMYASFAYTGWNAAAYVAGEVVRPERTLPRALLVGTGAVMALYVLLHLVFLYAIPAHVLSGPAGGPPLIEVGDLAARQLFGPRAGALVSLVIALALASAVSAMVMAGPRMYAAMAADRALPRALGRHGARGVPTTAVVVQGALGVALVLVADLGELLRFAGFALAVFSALTVAAVFVLRARGWRAPYRTFGYPVTPLVFLALSGWIIYAQVAAHPLESLAVVAVLAVGGVAYAGLRPRDRAALSEAKGAAGATGDPGAT